MLRIIARGNGVSAPGKLDITLRAPPPATSEGVAQLFSRPRLLPVTLILGYCWLELETNLREVWSFTMTLSKVLFSIVS